MRKANPNDLDQLAKLIDGRGGVRDKVDEAFTRAASLGVTSKLGALKPLRAWANDTAPDLRKRATIARLEDGDPQAGLLWAGFTPEELAKYQGDGLTPDLFLLANSVAASDDPKAYDFKRKPEETVNDYIERLTAHALEQIPGMPLHEETIATLVGIFGDWHSVAMAAGVVSISGTSLTRVLVGNHVNTTSGRALRIRIGAMLRSSDVGLVRWSGNKIVKWSPPIRSVSAPGSWMPGRLGGMFANSSTYQDAARVPGTTNVRGDLFGRGWDRFRALPFMQGSKANAAIDFVVGSDTAAKVFGGVTHSGQAVTRAGQANLFTVAGNAAELQRGVNAVPGAPAGSPFRAGLGAAAKTAGFLRGAGVVGGVAATGFSAWNAIDKDHGKAWKENKAKYIGDWAEVGFNASLTAAMIAPTPITIGAAVVTGVIYGGAKIVENWDGIKAGAGKAKDWVKEKTKGALKKLNPFD
ncbi:ABC transporter permease [Streptomyces sp. NPDC090045]|uniref:ABC transporter permease n=1 Tax=Streptomyces sp. NPDC090045 TaxID=3365927 RepID=UPI0037FEDF47